jgi:hypothetical protein
MATPHIEFDEFIMFSLEEAVHKFHQTQEYHLLRNED